MKKRYIFLTLILCFFGVINTNAQTWTQQGSDIDGEATGDGSGNSVSLSSDGSTVAIGAYLNGGNGRHAGHVRIYKNISGTWTQQGADIDGEAAGDRSGTSVSLSSDGSTVAIGARYNDGNGGDAGHVRIYKNINGTWTQQGSDIDGEAVGDQSGFSVSLSSDGSTVAIGALNNDGNGNSAGHVRIYKNISGTWTQQGSDIDGEAAIDYSGWSVSLSSDGSTVAIGAKTNDGNGSNAGHVRIYKNINGTWTQQGGDIDGEAADDQSGHSVSLSSDGSTVAIGALLNDGNGRSAGQVRIYKNVNGTWTQQGSDIDGEAAGDYSGGSVSLSSDGSTVAIGAAYNDGNGTFAGHVRIYKNINGTWTQQGSDIDGEAAVDQSGYSVSLSSDGSTVAIGALNNDGNGNSAGHVRIYSITTCTTTSSTDTITSCGSYTWTDGITYTSSNNTATDTFVNAAGCDSVVTLHLTISGIPNNGLVGYWPFNGNANDESTNGNNGTVNGASLTTDRFGNSNSAYKFDGINDRIEIDSNKSLEPSSLTLSAWFKTDTIRYGSLGACKGQAIVTYSPENWNIGPAYKVALEEVDNRRLYTGAWTRTPSPSWQDINAGNIIQNNQWYHVVITCDSSSGNHGLYLNGLLIGTRNSVLSYSDQIKLVFGGTYESSSGSFCQPFDGDIDDIGIWDRALSATEIATLYSAGAFISSTDTITSCGSYTWTDGVTYTSSNNTATDTFVNAAGCDSIVTLHLTISGIPNNGLVGYWPFNGNANDESTNGNNGTVNGASLTTDRFGDSNSAYKFDGINDYIDFGNPALLNPIPFSYTQSCWIKLFDYSAIIDPILSKRHQDNGHDWATVTVNSDTKVMFYSDDRQHYTNGNKAISPILDTSIWYHFTLVKSGYSYLMYMNGNLVDSIYDSHTMGGSNDNFMAGKQGAWNAFFKGKIDDIGIWNRALNATEIATLYSAGAFISPTDTITSCGSYTWTDGVTYTSSNNTAKDTFVNAAGCDSVVTLNLTINDVSIATDVQTACSSYTWTDGVTYTSSNNTAKDTFMSATGCDSIVTLSLTIDNIKPTVLTQNVTVSLDASGAGSITATQVDNGSTDNCSISTRTLSKSSFDCSEVGANTIYLIVTDVNGNVDSASAVITVEDNIKPTVLTQNVTVSLDASGAGSITVTQVDNGSTDNCTIASRTLSKSSFDCSNVGANTIYLIVTDVNGNVDSASAIITVEDNIKPTVLTQNVTVSLDASGAGSITATQVDNGSTDNCTIASRTLSKSSFDCSDVGANTIYLIVTDVNGNVDSASAIITVEDNIKPTVLTQNVTVSLDASGAGSITATQVDNGSTDNCTIATSTLSKSSFDCSNVGANTIWLRITDVNGNVDSASAVITVEDNIKPTVLTQNVTVSLDASGAGSITVTQVDNGSTDNCTIASRILSKSSFDCSNVGANTIYLIVTDVNGNVDSASAVITVEDNIKPTVLTQNVTVSLDASGAGSITATQVDNGSTDNCSISTRTLSKSSFDCSDVGANTTYLIVTDVNGNVDSASAVITVEDNIKPTVLTQNVTVSLDASGAGSVTATQVDNGSTDNCTIASRTLSKSSFDCSDVGANTIYLIVTDVNGNVDSASAVITVEDNIKPTVLTQNVTVSLDASGAGSVTATQVDNGSTDNCTIATRTFSKSSFDCSEVGANTIWLRITDVNGNVDSASAIITVEDNIKPTVLTQNVTVSLDASGAGSITATQVDNGSTDNCTIATRTLSKSSFDCSNVGANTIYLIITDVNGNVDSASAVITVEDNIKPTVLTQNVTVSLDASGVGSITAAQVDNGSTDNCTIATRTLSKSSFDCSEVGANTIWLRVTDANGNVDSANAVITVQDNIKPTVVTTPSDIALGYCDATYTYEIPTGDDNCSVTVTQIAGLAPGSTFPVGLTVNTFEIKDSSGNTVTTSFTVDIRDRYLPFTLTDLSLCENESQINLNQGFDNITFSGNGMQSDGITFNPIISRPGVFNIRASFIDSMGCTTFEQFNVEVRPSPVTPFIRRVASDQIVTAREYDKYQWYRNGTALEGETEQLLRVHELGIYSVLVGNTEKCFANSEGYGFGIPVSQEQVTNQGTVKVYPNPTEGLIFVEMSDGDLIHNLSLTNGLGVEVLTQVTYTSVARMDMSNLPPGTYFLHITSTSTNASIKLVKI